MNPSPRIERWLFTCFSLELERSVAGPLPTAPGVWKPPQHRLTSEFRLPSPFGERKRVCRAGDWFLLMLTCRLCIPEVAAHMPLEGEWMPMAHWSLANERKAVQTLRTLKVDWD